MRLQMPHTNSCAALHFFPPPDTKELDDEAAPLGDERSAGSDWSSVVEASMVTAVASDFLVVNEELELNTETVLLGTFQLESNNSGRLALPDDMRSLSDGLFEFFLFCIVAATDALLRLWVFDNARMQELAKVSPPRVCVFRCPIRFDFCENVR